MLVFLYITFEAPLSGMSINPARTLASALPSGVWTAGWIYLVAPVGGMLLAVELYRGLRRGKQVACAKWNHDMRYRCIFCGHPGMARMRPAEGVRKAFWRRPTFRDERSF